MILAAVAALNKAMLPCLSLQNQFDPVQLMEFMEVTPETLDQRCRYPESNDLGEILYGVDDVCNEYSCKATEIEDELLEFFESKNQMNKMNKMNQHNRNCKRLYRAIVHEACNEKRNGHVWGEENPKAAMEKLKKERNAAKNIEMRKKIQGRINRLKKDWEKDLEDDEDDDVTFDRRQKEPRNDSRIKKCHVLVIYFLKDGPKACARDLPVVHVGPTSDEEIDTLVKQERVAAWKTVGMMAAVFAVYVALVALLGWCYTKLWSTPVMSESKPDVEVEEFRHGVFSCFEDMHICALSFCCMPYRWADTMKAAGVMSFWTGVLIFFVVSNLRMWAQVGLGFWTMARSLVCLQLGFKATRRPGLDLLYIDLHVTSDSGRFCSDEEVGRVSLLLHGFGWVFVEFLPQNADQDLPYFKGEQKGNAMETSHRELLISHISSSSAIIIEAEACRQRYKRLHPKDCADDEKDYKTLVHTLTQERLSAIFKTKIEEGACKTGLCGLKEEQARVYFNVYGKNEITPPKRENIWIKLLRQTFLGIFNILLWSCVIAEVALIVIFSGEGSGEETHHSGKEGPDYVTPIILSAVIVMAALLQWYSELKAEVQMEAMQKLQAASKVPTVRMDHGRRVDLELDPLNLVPGDIIFVQAGDRIPADVRILHCTDGTEVDNSALTGESMPEPRHNKTEPVTCPPPEARNLAFFGTTVLKGNATCVVHATGDATFLGKIAQGIKSSRVKSTLEIQIEHFVHIIAVVAICVGLLSLLANLLSPVKRGPAEILQNSAAALFAKVPEGLLPTVTISLMIASDQMASRNVIVRKIDAVETLGCVSVFCSDKTGTLTTGEMATQDLVVPSSASFSLEVHRRDRDSGLFKSQKLLEDIATCGVLNNGAEIFQVDGGEERWTGSPTEVAILRACAEVNGGSAATATLKQRPENFKTFEIPFNSENKWMLTIHGDQNVGYFAILKGAPERVMKYTTLQSDPSIVGKVEQQLQDLMGQGRRVLCIAKKDLDANDVPKGGKFEGTNATDCNFPMKDFKFVGLYGIEDPPKKGVAEAVLDAQKAGVKVVMVTGDHPDTARAIAGRINILGSAVETPANEAEQLQGAVEFSVITGEELADIEEGSDEIVANKKDFFHEIDEVRLALKKAVAVDLPQAMCRETCERIGQIWSQYQEQPALLDPFMEEMVEPLMATIAAKVRQKDLENPNLHLLSSLMYLLTTVRGYKTVVRLFPHEAADLEPCLEAAEEEAKKENLETWSTLYCLTLWLGMVLLTPFDLSTIDSGHESRNSLSDRIFSLALQGLRSTSRTRDASAWMLAKFFGRPDVSGTGLLQSFVTWTRDAWVDQTKSVTAQAFVKSGALQAWNQTLKLAPRSVMSGLWTQVLRLVLDGPSGSSDDFGSSNLRKLRVAVACRAALVILPPRLAPWRYERGQRSLLVNFAQATGGSIAAAGAGANEASGANIGLEEDGDFGQGMFQVQMPQFLQHFCVLLKDDEAPEEVEEVVEPRPFLQRFKATKKNT
ncbi:unnamed protein product [Cladocopium goreaui]|uniref:Cation-transporting P-type ATPase N-terminal domain-containing protein n=1 Tax=Cladocopium goreaui TaxID=2562237 RepID=A0A9P1DL16_9DINO|nr:unnamed protein product [Cladocopium goreaui]